MDNIDTAIGGYLSLSVAGASDVTLTATQALNNTLELTGVLTGNISVIVPAREKSFDVYNNTTGDFTLTVKTSAGTGIQVLRGERATLYCDATNVARFSHALDEMGLEGAALASATTTNIWQEAGTQHITGTTTITSLGTAPRAGACKKIIFDGALTLTHGANLNLPGGANITTAADDWAVIYADTTTQMDVIAYFKKNGEAVVTEISRDTSPQLGGTLDTNAKQVRYSKGADVASANALSLGTDGNYFDITGTTAITSIGTLAAGTHVKLHFDGILTLTHHATDLILPGAANITTAAGDEAEFVEYATGDWRCTSYVKASGEAVVASSGKVAQIVRSTDSTIRTYAGTFPSDDTIPQNTEGSEHLTIAITPTNASSTLLIRWGFAATVSTSKAQGALFVDTTADALFTWIAAGNNPNVAQFALSAASTSARTYKLRVGDSAGNLIVNEQATNDYGTKLTSFLEVWEITP